MEKIMLRTVALLTLMVLGGLLSAGQTQAVTLWYNGDLNSQTAAPNQRNPSTGFQAAVYDDFIVPSGEAWNVTELFSNNISVIGGLPADYEIRQGVSNGNGGSLVYSGAGVFAFEQFPGGSFLGQPVIGLHVPVAFSLDPGTYWLMVRQVTPTGIPQILATSGLNAVGMPPGNNGNAFASYQTSLFFPTTDYNPAALDFSMGIIGTSVPLTSPVPEPCTMLLLGSGLAGVVGLRRRCKR